MIICTFVAGGMLFIGQAVSDAHLCYDRGSMIPSYTTTSLTWIPVPHLRGVQTKRDGTIAFLRGCGSQEMVSTKVDYPMIPVFVQTECGED